MEYNVDIADEDCVRHCRDGYPDGFRFLVERYQGPLYAYLFTQLGDRAQAEDAAQEAFVRAFFSIRKLKKPESFYSWLIGIARRVAHEQRRAARRRADVGREAAIMAAPPERQASDLALDEAIAALPGAQRRVILLRYYEQLSCREVADRLNLPCGTVTKYLSRAYAQLRQSLTASPQHRSLTNQGVTS